MSGHMYGVDPHLIQDITQANVPSHRTGRMNRTASIGELDDIWHRQARSAFHGLGMTPWAVTGESHRPRGYSPRLRVAPLSLLDAQLSGASGRLRLRGVADTARRFWRIVVAVSIAAVSKARSWRITALPTKYTLRRGVIVDLSTPVIRAAKQYGIPLIGIGVALVLLVMTLPERSSSLYARQSRHHLTVAPQSSTDSKQHSSDSQVSQSSGMLGVTAKTGNNAPIAASMTGSGLASGYGVTGLQAPPKLQTSGSGKPQHSGVPGVTSPYPVTTPGQSVMLGGKPAVNISPATLTLN